MATIPAESRIDGERLAQSLEEACHRLETAEGEIVLNFSSIERLDPAAVAALKTLAAAAEEKNVKLLCRGVNVAVYKVLKLVKVAQHLSFVN